MSKFQFGDIVKSCEYIALLDKPLCFFRYSEKSNLAECLEQDGTFHFLKVEDLELVPHADTVRLDFIIECIQGCCRESYAGIHDYNGANFSFYSIYGCGDGKTPREAIDGAFQSARHLYTIKQEQTK